MTNSPPLRVRIYSHVTRSRFLHIEDALSIDKLRLFAGNYQRGQGMTSYVQHYIDSADARVILAALADAKVGFSHRAYKGTPPQKRQGAISRVLDVSIKEDKAYLELKSGAGKLTPTGAILPAGAATEAINVAFSLYEAQRLAHVTLAYLRAFDVLRMQRFQQEVGMPSPYTLVSTSAPTLVLDGRDVMPTVAPAGTLPPSEQADNDSDEDRNVLHYGDGRVVSAENVAEKETFACYQQEHHKPPESKQVLQTYYLQQAVAA